MGLNMCEEILSLICIGHLYSIPFVAMHCTSSLIAFIYCRLKQKWWLYCSKQKEYKTDRGGNWRRSVKSEWYTWFPCLILGIIFCVFWVVWGVGPRGGRCHFWILVIGSRIILQVLMIFVQFLQKIWRLLK